MSDEIEIDFTNAPTQLFPDVPPWLENEPKDFGSLFSANTLAKAAILIGNDKLVEFKDGWWEVIGSELYTVQVLENPYGGVPWTTCTCPNGTNRASRPTCYHSCAVLMKILGTKPAT